MATFTTTPGHLVRSEDGGFSVGLFHENSEGVALVEPIAYRVHLTTEGVCSKCGEDFYEGADAAMMEAWKRHYSFSRHLVR